MKAQAANLLALVSRFQLAALQEASGVTPAQRAVPEQRREMPAAATFEPIKVRTAALPHASAKPGASGRAPNAPNGAWSTF